MSQSRHINDKPCAIIADGPFLSREILEEAIQGKKIIALDGAANKLLDLNIRPHIILGDFDSVEPNKFAIEKTFAELSNADEPYLSKKGFWIVPAKDQKWTDLSKAIVYCDANKAASITLLCAAGGRLDHHEGALRSLRVHYHPERPILLHTEQQTICYAKDETITMNGQAGDKVGILAYPQGCISSKGLEYEVAHFELNFGFKESTCNALLASKAIIEVMGEALLIMPPQLKTQRTFTKMTTVQKLEILLRDAKLMSP